MMNVEVFQRRRYLDMIPSSDVRIEEKMAKILVVDDDANSLFGVSRILSHAGFDVITANNGYMGLRKAENEQPDLILLDLNMPVMNSFQTKEMLDSTPATRYTPTIFLTAMSDRTYMLDGLTLADDYITKPFDAEVLIARLKTILRRVDMGYKLAIQDSKKAIYSTSRIQQWGQAVEIHDNCAAGHTQRVTCWFAALVQSLGAIRDPETLDFAIKGAMLHDIGKLAIPDEILNKSGPLNDDEWEIMHEHPTAAVEMLKVIEQLKPALDIPHYHHERWDGNGYPEGLSGEAIPLCARIFSVVDVYDALISVRPYKMGLEEKTALEMIQAESGKYFDPRIVEHFLSHFDSLKTTVADGVY